MKMPSKYPYRIDITNDVYKVPMIHLSNFITNDIIQFRFAIDDVSPHPMVKQEIISTIELKTVPENIAENVTYIPIGISNVNNNNEYVAFVNHAHTSKRQCTLYGYCKNLIHIHSITDSTLTPTYNPTNHISRGLHRCMDGTVIRLGVRHGDAFQRFESWFHTTVDVTHEYTFMGFVLKYNHYTAHDYDVLFKKW